MHTAGGAQCPISMVLMPAQQAKARLEQLAEPRTTLWDRCSAERAEREAAQLRGCTFKPSVNGKPPAGEAHITTRRG